MGGRPRAREATPHERDHDVHVRQFPADFQYHDGFHVVQEPPPGAVTDESGFRKVRDAADEE